MSDAPILQLLGVNRAFGDTIVLDDVNLTIKTGSVIAIVGASGVGKSTLFHIAAGLLAPTTGRVLVDGVDRTGKPFGAGYMLQQDLLLPFKSVYANIALPLTLQKWDKAAVRAKIEPLLPVFGLENLTDRYPSQLSGGQRQRAALLRTYLSNDRLMLLDEPFSALDYLSKTDMQAWFSSFQRQKRLTCLIITHDIDEAMHLADEVYTLVGSPGRLERRFLMDKSDDFLQSADFLRQKRAILAALRS